MVATSHRAYSQSYLHFFHADNISNLPLEPASYIKLAFDWYQDDLVAPLRRLAINYGICGLADPELYETIRLRTKKESI